MCDSSLNSEDTSYGFSASRTYSTGGTESRSESRGRCFYCSSICTNDPASCGEGPEGDHAQIEADLLAFQQMLYRAAQTLTVARFMQLRQRYDLVWYEVLENL